MSSLRDRQRTRRTLFLAALAGVLGLVAVVSHFGGGAPVQASGRTGTPVFPDFEALRAEASEIRITLADERYSLVATGDGWRLGTRDGYPIRQDRLTELAAGLESLVWDTPRTDDPEKLNRIGLGDPRDSGTGALLEVIGPDGETGAALITGRKGEFIYGRRPDETTAFRVTGTLPPLYSAEAWLDLGFLDINEDAVSAVRLTDEAGETLFLQREVGSSDRAFRPAPPFQNYRLTSRLAVTGPAMALTRFLPIGVKPASALRTRPVSRHITQTHDGLEVDVRAYRERDGFFITLRAIEAGEGAMRAEAINARAAGWAFELTATDWADYTPRVADIVRPPA
ncbi:DUF4340 domain-containing protein [Hyphomonas sp.]|jgi:hypothetical protein|uniref:DUF4340 domain-containing protein n=1 Tax=Hyphomonas sp. TaxID=87 RepID=UPI0025BCE240|nr:DUF4340 domain-containing protein [Hyphomonas sp.]